MKLTVIQIVAILLGLSHCTSPEKQPNDLFIKARKDYPQKFRTVHRAVLKIKGKEFDFTGYLLVHQPSTFHAAAYAEAGAAIFELQKIGSNYRILKKPEFIPKSIMIEVMNDLNSIYALGAPREETQLKLDSYKVFRGWGNPIPTKIAVVNSKLSYHIDIDVVSFERGTPKSFEQMINKDSSH